MDEIRIVQEALQREGNLQRYNHIYITPQNMMYFRQDVIDYGVMPDILITPYLISNDGGSLYELHYYEFDLDIGGNKSHYIEYNAKNSLPEEITKNIKPRAVIADGDIEFYVSALSNYLYAMNKMQFKEDREHYPQLKNAPLYFELFMDGI